MTEDLMDLARRAVAVVPIERWPDWTPVRFRAPWDMMLEGVLETGRNGAKFVTDPDGGELPADCVRALPLLDTPAGLGSLESVARQRNSGNLAVYIGNGWFSVETDSRDMDDDNCESLAHALVRAMESAP